MFRGLFLLAGGLVVLSAGSASAENAILEQMYGSGVHAYFSQDYVKSHEYLTTIIDARKLTNFRAKLIHEPAVIRRTGDPWGDGSVAQAYAEAWAAWPMGKKYTMLSEVYQRYWAPRQQFRNVLARLRVSR